MFVVRADFGCGDAILGSVLGQFRWPALKNLHARGGRRAQGGVWGSLLKGDFEEWSVGTCLGWYLNRWHGGTALHHGTGRRIKTGWVSGGDDSSLAFKMF